MYRVRDRSISKGSNKMQLRNPSTRTVIDVSSLVWLWTFIFNFFYFAFKGVWLHAIISLLLIYPTMGLSCLVYPFFARSILIKHYLKQGWIPLDSNADNIALSPSSQSNIIEKYKVTFSGKIVNGQNIEQVKKRVAAMYKVPVEKCNCLFTGKLATIKDNLDLQVARKYKKIFERTGAICQIIPIDNSPKVFKDNHFLIAKRNLFPNGDIYDTNTRQIVMRANSTMGIISNLLAHDFLLSRITPFKMQIQDHSFKTILTLSKGFSFSYFRQIAIFNDKKLLIGYCKQSFFSTKILDANKNVICHLQGRKKRYTYISAKSKVELAYLIKDKTNIRKKTLLLVKDLKLDILDATSNGQLRQLIVASSIVIACRSFYRLVRHSI